MRFVGSAEQQWRIIAPDNAEPRGIEKKSWNVVAGGDMIRGAANVGRDRCRTRSIVGLDRRMGR
jgi:hypothetical protein